MQPAFCNFQKAGLFVLVEYLFHQECYVDLTQAVTLTLTRLVVRHVKQPIYSFNVDLNQSIFRF